MHETTKGCDVLPVRFLWLRIGVPTEVHHDDVSSVKD